MNFNIKTSDPPHAIGINPTQEATNSNKSHSRINKIKTNMGKLADAAHRYGITVTGFLPFSSRGVFFNLAHMSVSVSRQLIQNRGKNFSHTMKTHLVRDWNQGISDSYINLESSKNAELRKDVVKNYSSYVNGIYLNSLENRSLTSLLSPSKDFITDREFNQKFEIIKKEITNIGFELDTQTGKYYDKKTGNMFHFAYDREKKEVIACFMGLGSEWNTDLDRNTKIKITLNSVNTVLSDWFGGIPPATLQAIKIGNILKTATEGSILTPVMVGHSNGGGLAQSGAVANGIKGVTFNSRPMGAGTRRYIGQSKIAKNAQHLTTFSGKGDWLTGCAAVNHLAAVFERLTGIIVPRSVGTGYHLPKIPGSSHHNHNFFDKAFDQLKEMDKTL